MEYAWFEHPWITPQTAPLISAWNCSKNCPTIALEIKKNITKKKTENFPGIAKAQKYSHEKVKELEGIHICVLFFALATVRIQTIVDVAVQGAQIQENTRTDGTAKLAGSLGLRMGIALKDVRNESQEMP